MAIQLVGAGQPANTELHLIFELTGGRISAGGAGNEAGIQSAEELSRLSLCQPERLNVFTTECSACSRGEEELSYPEVLQLKRHVNVRYSALTQSNGKQRIRDLPPRNYHPRVIYNVLHICWVFSVQLYLLYCSSSELSIYHL